MPSESERIIHAVAPQLGGGGQVQHDSAGVWEWRGVLYDLKTRVRAETLYCNVQVQAQNPLGRFMLKWGPRFVHDPSAADNDAFDPTDEVRVWVGRNVVIECYGLELDEQVAGFRAFPPQGTAYLVDAMQRDAVCVLAVEPDELVGFVVREQPDVVAATVRFTQLLAWTGAQLRLVAPSAPQMIAAARSTAGGTQLRCRYCRALFLLSQTGKCPNCGAPAA